MRKSESVLAHFSAVFQFMFQRTYLDLFTYLTKWIIIVERLHLSQMGRTACLTDPARVQPGGKMSHPGPTRSQKSAPGLNPQTRDRFHRNPGKNRRNPETETRNPDRIFENPGLTRPVKPETRWTRSKNFSRSGSVRQAV